MNKEIKQKIPKWVNEDTKYNMCMTDDIDSLFSCILLQEIKGYTINNFYTFSKLYQIAEPTTKIVGVDMDIRFADARCWSNHVVRLSSDDMDYNKNAANLNTICNISRDNYFQKYCGSTLLEIVSYYEYPIWWLDEEAKMVLLAIDSTYKGFFSKYENDNKANKYYLCDVLELQELYELQSKHTMQDFLNIIKKYNLDKKIYINEEGRLETEINLQGLSRLFDLPISLPVKKFELIKTYTPKSIMINDDFIKQKPKKTAIFSLALTQKNRLNYSLL